MVSVDWKEKRIKHILDLINGGTPKSNVEEYWSENEIIWITPEDLSKPGKTIENSIRKISRLGLENSSTTFIKEGSIVISTRAPIGNMKISTVPFTTNQGCKSLQLKDSTNDIRFFYYWLYVNKDYLNQLGRGTTFPELSNYDLKNIKLNVPVSNEQTNIANFLDIKSSEIDSLISDKERLIELLEEKRQAIITETVTKGLDPNVKMKDSGIEWIGEIPEHWESLKFKFVGKLINGYAFPSTSFTEHGIRVIKITNIQSMNINWEDESFISEAFYKRFPQYRVIKNDLVISLTRPIISSGIKAAIIDTDEKLLLNQRNALFRGGDMILIPWLYYIILNQNFIEEFESLIDGTGQQPNIATNDIENIKIPLPSRVEQQKIIDYLNGISLEIEILIEKNKKIINKLKEYRESLIYEAVTGKIDLRDYKVEKTED